MIASARFDHCDRNGEMTKTPVLIKTVDGLGQQLTQISAFDGRINVYVHSGKSHRAVVVEANGPVTISDSYDSINECLDWVTDVDDDFSREGAWWHAVKDWAKSLL